MSKCSGTLLSTQRHVLTAAHCLTGPFGVFDVTSVEVVFQTTTGDIKPTVGSSSVLVHPAWNGFTPDGNDIAVLELPSQLSGVSGFEIYRHSDELFQVGTKLGYGASGEGFVDRSTYPAGTKRIGQNRYELFKGNNDILIYDFDSGDSVHDTIGAVAGVVDIGLGEDEILGIEGDSGGPTFITGRIAGVTSHLSPRAVVAALSTSATATGETTCECRCLRTGSTASSARRRLSPSA
jgi:hypothetical protein